MHGEVVKRSRFPQIFSYYMYKRSTWWWLVTMATTYPGPATDHLTPRPWYSVWKNMCWSTIILSTYCACGGILIMECTTCTVAVIDIATYPLEFQWISTWHYTNIIWEEVAFSWKVTGSWKSCCNIYNSYCSSCIVDRSRFHHSW